MSGLQPVRGTHDLLPEDMRRHRHVVETAGRAAFCFGYHEVATPIFEFTEVFKRTLGDTSDVVTKEMYTFTDKGGEIITLRPENTAGVARALTQTEIWEVARLQYIPNQRRPLSDAPTDPVALFWLASLLLREGTRSSVERARSRLHTRLHRLYKSIHRFP